MRAFAFARFFVPAVIAGCTLAAAVLSGCASTEPSRQSVVLDKPASYTGKVVGPIVRGQPEDGTQFTSYELELRAPVNVNDRADCGPQQVRRIPIENDEMTRYLGKHIRISGTVYCRINRTGTYHLNEVTDVLVLP